MYGFSSALLARTSCSVGSRYAGACDIGGGCCNIVGFVFGGVSTRLMISFGENSDGSSISGSLSETSSILGCDMVLLFFHEVTAKC